jgi:glycerophosphoryl diester phosphodiesterase
VRLRRANGRYIRVAHRGAAALAPENTIAGLEAALVHEVDWVEMDVVRAGDRLMLAHSFAELRPESPTLADSLAFLAARSDHERGLQLDVKGWGFEREIVDTLRRFGLVDRTVVSSHFTRALTAVRRLEPEIATGLAYPFDRYGATQRQIPDVAVRSALAAMRHVLPRRIGLMLRRAQADAAMLHHRVLSPPLVERCHELGVAVFAWTVNDVAALDKVLALGVDGVISDEPPIFAPSSRE